VLAGFYPYTHDMYTVSQKRGVELSTQ